MDASPQTARRAAADEALLSRFHRVRATTRELAAPLSPEDQLLQSMPDASPTKWHLAHTTWFFEAFVLRAFVAGYQPFPGEYEALFNSYYHSVGPQYPRDARGLLSRPSLPEVLEYRWHVEGALDAVLAAGALDAAALAAVELGLQHEQQHQELLLTDIKHALSCNPLQPAYHRAAPVPRTPAADLAFVGFEAATTLVGAVARNGMRAGFCFDNELPRHPVLLAPCRVANRLVTNAEYRAFIEDGGYRDPLLWLADGWAEVTRHQWQRPLYWSASLDHEFSLEGGTPIDPGVPVAHVSLYEADAFARWAGARLPTEAEWEHVAGSRPVDGNFLDSKALRPRAAQATAGAVTQLFGDLWEWTQSAYSPYPGFRAPSGALGEYNGKFMINQVVLRGGSCASPRSHLRASYRNFFPPAARWQFSGIRLAQDT